MPKTLPELLIACRRDIQDLNALCEPIERERKRLKAQPKPTLHPMIEQLKGKHAEDLSVAQIVENIAAAERDGRWIAAELGRAKLRELTAEGGI